MDRLTALQAFVRVVERGSFTAAAAELRVKQSTVSKWVAGLEDELGVRLFDRTTRALRVTEAGERLHPRAVALLMDYESALAVARDEATALRGRVRVSVPVVFGHRFVAPLAASFLTEHEEVELELFFGDRYVNLVEEAFDLAIRVGTPVDSSLRSHALADGPRRLVAAPAYVERHGAPKHPRELEQHRCLVHTGRGAVTSWSFSQGDDTIRVRVGGRVAANHSESVLQLAQEGLGIALLAGWLVDEAVEAGRLMVLLEDYEVPSAPVRALTPPGRFVPPRVRAFIAHLRAGLAKG